MGKEKQIVVFLKDHTVKITSCDNIKKICKSGEAKYVLIPVGIEESQFIVLNPKYVMYNILSADITMNLGITRIYDSIYATDSPIKKIHCDNMVEFYQIMHSFQKMSAFNIVFNSNSLSDFADKEFYSVSSFEMVINTKKGTRKFVLTEEDKNRVTNYRDDSPCMIAALTKAVDEFFYIGESYGKPSLIPGETQPTFYVDFGIGVWQSDDDVKKNKYFDIIAYKDIDPFDIKLPYAKSFNMHLNGSISFVPPEDWALLKKYTSNMFSEIALFSTAIYCEMTSPDIWPYEDRIDVETIYTDTSNFYCPIKNDYPLYTTSDLFEILHMIIHIIKSMITIKQIAINNEIDRFCAEVMLVLQLRDKNETFKFNVFDDEIDNDDGIYNRFMTDLRKFIIKKLTIQG